MKWLFFVAIILALFCHVASPPPLHPTTSPKHEGGRGGGHNISCSGLAPFECTIYESTLHHCSYILPLPPKSRLGLNNYELLTVYKTSFYEIPEDNCKAEVISVG